MAIERFRPRPSGNGQDVIPYERGLRYPIPPEVSLPEQPSTEIRTGGFFGCADRQDLAHERRLRQLRQLGVEVAYTESMAVAVEAKGIKTTSDGMGQAEAVVYALPSDTVAGMLSADLASEMAARSHVRHSRLMETLDAEALNIIHRR